MAVAFQCEQCGKDFEVADELAGKRCRCKRCGHEFTIPKRRSTAGFAPAAQEWDDDAPPRRSRPSGPKSSPQPFAREIDPYGFDDEPRPKAPPRVEPDLDEILPQRPKPPVKRRRKRAKSEVGQFVGLDHFSQIPIWVFLLGAFFGFVIARQIWVRNSAELHPAWIVLAFLSYTMSISGSLGCLVVAFREGPSHGLCCMFMPFYILYYIFSRWEYARDPFLVSVAGYGLLCGACAIDPDGFNMLVNDRNPKVAAGPGNPWPPEPPGLAPPPWRGGPGGRVQVIPDPKPHHPVTPAPEPVVLKDFTDQALADLKSPEPHLRKAALGRLKGAPPNDRRDEVARAVEPLLADPDGFTRCDAAGTLAVWGGPENTPALLKGLQDPAFNVRWAILDALKAMRDPQAAEALTEYMMTSDDRGRAAKALKEIGPSAEGAVLRGLTHHDEFVRMEVCNILQAIGTRKCVPALQGLLRRNRGHGLDGIAAGEALRHIASRNPR